LPPSNGVNREPPVAFGKKEMIMKRVHKIVAGAAGALAIVAATAYAAAPDGGYGPYGNCYGAGPGGAGWGHMGMMYGAGPGGYGMGPGMMWGGPGGYPMGPGAMWGGPGGYGRGPGMMGGGPGGYGMGPGPMGSYRGDAYAGLDLSADQRKKIAEIQAETSKTMWQEMQKMHELGYPAYGAPGQAPADEQAARKAYQAMADAQKAIFDQQLQARKQIDAVLTKEQREQLQRYWGGGR
jgi:Spy/CpxP family protein refolding chaperone